MRSLNYRLWQDSFGYQRLSQHCAILPHAAQQINELATKFYVRNVGYDIWRYAATMPRIVSILGMRFRFGQCSLSRLFSGGGLPASPTLLPFEVRQVLEQYRRRLGSGG
jgi:hypothetical protein